MRIYDVVIVGAGPIGIELAVALSRAGIDYAHVEAGAVGQTLTWWAPCTRFFSSPERIAIAGVPLVGIAQEKATREEYLAYLRAVVEQFDLPIAQHEPVTAIDREGQGNDALFTLHTKTRTGERTWRARRVVLAIGDMHEPRTLGIPGENLPHVSHYLTDPHRFFRQRVVIVGGKNSAIEAAIRCHRVGARVTLAQRRKDVSERVKYWLRPEFLALVKTGAIEFLPELVPIRITDTAVQFGPALAGTTLPSPEFDAPDAEEPATPASGAPGHQGAGPTREVPADFVLLMTGYVQDPTLFRLAGVELVGDGLKPSHNPRTMETNVPGLYVAGTAAAGTQLHGVKVFIETAHVHARRILAAITGHHADESDLEEPEYVLPES